MSAAAGDLDLTAVGPEDPNTPNAPVRIEGGGDDEEETTTTTTTTDTASPTLGPNTANSIGRRSVPSAEGQGTPTLNSSGTATARPRLHGSKTLPQISSTQWTAPLAPLEAVANSSRSNPLTRSPSIVDHQNTAPSGQVGANPNGSSAPGGGGGSGGARSSDPTTQRHMSADGMSAHPTSDSEEPSPNLKSKASVRFAPVTIDTTSESQGIVELFAPPEELESGPVSSTIRTNSGSSGNSGNSSERKNSNSTSKMAMSATALRGIVTGTYVIHTTTLLGERFMIKCNGNILIHNLKKRLMGEIQGHPTPYQQIWILNQSEVIKCERKVSSITKQAGSAPHRSVAAEKEMELQVDTMLQPFQPRTNGDSSLTVETQTYHLYFRVVRNLQAEPPSDREIASGNVCRWCCRSAASSNTKAVYGGKNSVMMAGGGGNAKGRGSVSHKAAAGDRGGMTNRRQDVGSGSRSGGGGGGRSPGSSANASVTNLMSSGDRDRPTSFAKDDTAVRDSPLSRTNQLSPTAPTVDFPVPDPSAGPAPAPPTLVSSTPAMAAFPSHLGELEGEDAPSPTAPSPPKADGAAHYRRTLPQ